MIIAVQIPSEEDKFRIIIDGMDRTQEILGDMKQAIKIVAQARNWILRVWRLETKSP